MLKKTYIKNQGRILGSITEGFQGSFEFVVRDENDAVLGRCSEQFATTRDQRGALVSTNSADPGLLMKRS